MVLYRQESIWMVAELREGGREKEEGEGRCVVILPANFQIPGKKRGGEKGVGEEESVSHRLTLLCEK